MSDMERLREYVRHGAEAPFAEVVQRQINLVYSTAFRHVGMAAQAEEITQAVFVILARKAGSLRPDTVLEAWLYETTRLASISFLRSERRRQAREQEVYMQSDLPEGAVDSVWEQLEPLLDEAMARLGKTDREAVVLRFFKEKNLREVAAALQVNEATAQKRVSRAVEKLRKFFTKRGVAVPLAALTTAISANSVKAAPVALAKSVTAVALTKGVAASSSTLTLIKGALKLMAWTKAKVAVVVGVGMLLAAATTTVVVSEFAPSQVQPTDEMWMADLNGIRKLPPFFVLRPTKFPDKPSGMMADGKYVYRNQAIDSIFGIAYPGIGSPRCIQNVQIPRAGYNWEKPAAPKLTNGYDLMLALTNQPIEALQREIKKQFGFVAVHEMIVTNVVVLKVAAAKSATPGLKPGKGYAGGSINVIDGVSNPYGYTATNEQSLVYLASAMEIKLGLPVLDRTGLNGFYDVTLSWDWVPLAQAAGNTEKYLETQRRLIEQALQDQLGLELVPAREPIEMLVVEKVK